MTNVVNIPPVPQIPFCKQFLIFHGNGEDGRVRRTVSQSDPLIVLPAIPSRIQDGAAGSTLWTPSFPPCPYTLRVNRGINRPWRTRAQWQKQEQAWETLTTLQEMPSFWVWGGGFRWGVLGSGEALLSLMSHFCNKKKSFKEQGTICYFNHLLGNCDCKCGPKWSKPNLVIRWSLIPVPVTSIEGWLVGSQRIGTRTPQWTGQDILPSQESSKKLKPQQSQGCSIDGQTMWTSHLCMDHMQILLDSGSLEWSAVLSSLRIPDRPSAIPGPSWTWEVLFWEKDAIELWEVMLRYLWELLFLAACMSVHTL